MKLRAGFVTNSSSYSYVYISVKNKALCDIVNKYLIAPGYYLRVEDDELIYDDNTSESASPYFFGEGITIREKIVNGIFQYLSGLILNGEEHIECNDDSSHDVLINCTHDEFLSQLNDNKYNVISHLQSFNYRWQDTFTGDQIPCYEPSFKESFPNEPFRDGDDPLYDNYVDEYSFEVMDGNIKEEKDEYFIPIYSGENKHLK